MRAFAKHIPLLGVSATLLAACGYDNGSGHHYVDPSSNQQTDPTIYSATIDADATMTDLNPGQGVGVMIEYGSGGTWYVKLTCDTSKTNLSCVWQIDAQSLDKSNIGGIDSQQLDGDDTVQQPSHDVIWFDGVTTTELDAFSFQADAGKPIGFYVWLQDEYESNRYVFWIGDGWLNKGISGPSFDLYPNSP